MPEDGGAGRPKSHGLRPFRDRGRRVEAAVMSASTISRIGKQLEMLDPDSLRYRALAALRQFRSSWVELGRLLTEVAYDGDYKQWGYDEFEIYCARELGLKKPTVKKLMISYNYMKAYEPKRLHTLEDGGGDEPPPEVPEYQTVELLHRLRQRGDLGEQDQKRLHDRAFSGEEEGDLRQQLRERLRSGPTGEEVGAADSKRQRELADILRTARLLRHKLAHARAVPGGLRDRFEQLLLELEAID